MGGGGGGGGCAGMLSNDTNDVGFTTFGGHDIRGLGGGGGLSILYPINFWDKYPLSSKFQWLFQRSCSISSNLLFKYPVSRYFFHKYPVPILIEYISFSSQFFWIETAKSIVIGMDQPVRIQTGLICLNCIVLHS